jgi:toxin ParE1/3/4
MTLRLVLTPRAVRDLEDIWDYTADRWGLDQAESYLKGVYTALQSALTNPSLLRPCDDVREGYSKVAVGSHVAFVRIGRGRLEVVRILHRRMDFPRHL